MFYAKIYLFAQFCKFILFKTVFKSHFAMQIMLYCNAKMWILKENQ